MTRRFLLLAALALAAAPSARADSVITFEGLRESDLVTTQFQSLGVIFNGPQVLTAGSSLNEVEFPPFSGVNVVTNNAPGTGGVIQANAVGGLWTSVSGYVTGDSAVTMTAFAADSSALMTVGTNGANFVGNNNGLIPNIQLLIGIQPARIAFVRFSTSAGGSFTLDDFRFNAVAQAVPEPSTLTLATMGGVGLLGYCWWRRERV